MQKKKRIYYVHMLHPTIYMCRCIYRCVFIRRPSGSWARRPHYYNNIIKFDKIEIYSLNLAPPGPPYPPAFRSCHLQNALLRKPFGSSGRDARVPTGMSHPGSLDVSLEPARAKWTLTLHGHRARGQSARARSSQMDFAFSSFLDKLYQTCDLENDPILAPKMVRFG